MYSKFQCWRCDKVTSEGKKCGACGMAYYCTDRCRINDEFRHSGSECEDVAVRYVCHGCKKKKTTQLKMCTNCMKVWFCDRQCQVKAWQSHKEECQAISKATIELGSRLNGINTIRMAKPGMSQLYYWGNTPAIDLLNLPMNEGMGYTEPLSLLLCGVGDPRKVCFTISKLQDAEYKGKVTFVMNDICSCTLARTLLLLYLLCKGGESKARSVTQIWYSLYLSEEDHQFVIACLRDLIQISNLEVITHGIMKMNAEQFSSLKNVWITWLHLSRKEFDIFGQRRQQFDNDRSAAYGMKSYIEEIPRKHQRSAQEWLQNGMLCSEQNRKNLTKENFTLMGSSFQLDSNSGSYEYGVPTDSFPFNGWDYRIVSAMYPKTNSLTVMYNNYITDVLRKCAARLQNDNIHLSFILSNCTDVTPYLPEGMTYDRIMTSNLWDYIHLGDLLKFMKPLLNARNKWAVVVTETQNWIRQLPLLYDKKMGLTVGSAVRQKVLKDTGNKSIANSMGKQGFLDYCNITEEVTSFVRASLLDPSPNSSRKTKSHIPSLEKLAAEFGLRPRDFARRENTVAPFRWSLNCRRVSLLQGTEMSVEWSLIPIYPSLD
ncbi:uncharacterized protein LOC116308741 [Actinia tenebrosa]|uniref:Uncharacterized protein LOC116308741 n=1 Tax=Actinia tenebrosa TaxID=6105 RepID=A0A6P8J4U9_ACTTE|nr:uncharacterized protein LOC116308741 [Actinia tenebrosa]XP_031575082.1 uncharacterized protein LOC116308741 [Actinia tenebrosa]